MGSTLAAFIRSPAPLQSPAGLTRRAALTGGALLAGMFGAGVAVAAEPPSSAPNDLVTGNANSKNAVAKHAIAMHGEPALRPDFRQLRYANPDAPKGGRFIQGVLGTFDSLNPFIVKGLSVPGIRGYVVESLLARGYDEPFT